MKMSKFLVEAAIILEKNHRSGWGHFGCCGALCRVSSDYLKAKDFFADMMSPPDINRTCWWYGDPQCTPATQERVLALLFAAAIAESDGE